MKYIKLLRKSVLCVCVIVLLFITISIDFKFVNDRRNINHTATRNILRTDKNLCKQQNLTLLAKWKPWIPPKDTFSTLRQSPDKMDIQKLSVGGKWKPSNCSVNWNVAIIVPYRDRAEHLDIFLRNIHSFLQLQRVQYGIYIIEQIANSKYNRGMLLNVGFDVASKDCDYNCFIFHDVDLIPENATNFYHCGPNPRHLSHAVDKFQYKLPYSQIFGGVAAFTRAQFVQNNGYSNKYYMWGGEDDDMYSRNYNSGYKIDRPPPEVGRYKMLHHGTQDRNPYRFLLGRHSFRTKSWKTDGLSNLKYKIISEQRTSLFTRFTVDLEDHKAQSFIDDALKTLRYELPLRFRNANISDIEAALDSLKSHYRGPYQLAKYLQQALDKKGTSRIAIG